MTKQLSDLFNLDEPEDTDDDKEEEKSTSEPTDSKALETTMQTIDKIDKALPMVKNLEAHENEMDELGDLAKTAFTDIMDLAYNVDPSRAGRMMEVAGQMLGHAITAKSAKMDKKLKMLDLQLRKAKMDSGMRSSGIDEDAIDGEGVILDRNTLMQQVMDQIKLDAEDK
jgi:hypothetical protein